MKLNPEYEISSIKIQVSLKEARLLHDLIKFHIQDTRASNGFAVDLECELSKLLRKSTEHRT